MRTYILAYQHRKTGEIFEQAIHAEDFLRRARIQFVTKGRVVFEAEGDENFEIISVAQQDATPEPAYLRCREPIEGGHIVRFIPKRPEDLGKAKWPAHSGRSSQMSPP